MKFENKVNLIWVIWVVGYLMKGLKLVYINEVVFC